MAGLADRGRGPAQQPPRGADLGWLSHRRWEFDPGWWAISLFRRLGLVKVRLNDLVLMPAKRSQGDDAVGLNGSTDPSSGQGAS